MTPLFARLRSYWRSATRARQLDADMDEEMRFHVEQHAERLIREEHLDAMEARRRAYVAFGGVEKFKEEGRDTRGTRWLDAIWLDARLGIRMLVKYRGLTLVGGFAMAVAIAIGATFFEGLTELLDTRLPFGNGAQIVAVRQASGEQDAARHPAGEFVALREALSSIQELAAFRTVQHNLVSPGTPPEPIKVAEITASAFSLVATAPFMGRYVLEADEQAGASPVVVLGHQTWQSRFGSDPQIVGRTIALGGVTRRVVGVMPAGFRFPVDHHFWIPLYLDPTRETLAAGPELHIVGRLAPAVTLEQAQAELTTFSQRLATDRERPLAQQRFFAMPYTYAHLDLTDPALVTLLRAAQLLVGALTFVVAVNLAILVYARTVTRLSEIAVRTALGASRARILVQLFIEAFALSFLGAIVGLLLADVGLERMHALAIANGSVPFWLRFDLSFTTAAYAIVLAVIAALVMGVLPGLRATGRALTDNLRDLNARTGARLGPVWTSLVVAQVAVAVAVLPAAVYVASQVASLEVTGAGFATEKFVVGSLVLSDDATAQDRARVRARQQQLMSRLEREPGVASVTYSSSVPGFAGSRLIEFEGLGPDDDAGPHDVSALDVSVDFMRVYDARIIAGRPFASGDIGAANNVIVNETFAHRFLSGQSVIGTRFTDAGDDRAFPQRSYQIVGVVADFPRFPPSLSVDGEPTIYHAEAPGDIHPVVVSVRFGASVPPGFIDRFKEVGAEVDPSLQLRRVQPLSVLYDDLRSFWRYIAWGVGLVTMSVLLLSAAGIYALMSFTVAQRTREIGIRTALGAQPRRLMLNVFSRAIRQISAGVIIGTTLAAGVFSSLGVAADDAAAVLTAVAIMMLLVGLLATCGPARRGLRVQASDALRADA